jgi:glutaryl-CoA dehydrogenase
MAKLNPTDLFDVRSLLTEEEQMIQDSVARFVDERALPLLGEAFDKALFPEELIPEMAELGLLGCTIEGYGCAGLNGVSMA